MGKESSSNNTGVIMNEHIAQEIADLEKEQQGNITALEQVEIKVSRLSRAISKLQLRKKDYEPAVIKGKATIKRTQLEISIRKKMFWGQIEQTKG